ncbi:MAG TPA: SprT family zinc-dependent metalloprotease [Kiritimatiellia bacterium]|nr:SprT family zinc-dependent metalloprotease [Kiritimatiellia bacterium]HMP34155.1 SprT family zinc-dependent metalloprotease [Kiritimatiellia bacterium]
MECLIEIDAVRIAVQRKNIRNIHLRVYPPDGRVGISAPTRMPLDDIRAFAASKTAWIARHRERILSRTLTPAAAFTDGERHFAWGRALPLRIEEAHATPSVDVTHDAIVLQVREGTHTTNSRAALLDAWYRNQVRLALPALAAKWEPVLKVHATRWHVQKMTSRWGSCHTRKHHIRLNSELAKHPPECLEYVVVHELVHLLEPSHNRRFYHLMNSFLPGWNLLRKHLNQSPTRPTPPSPSPFPSPFSLPSPSSSP